MWCHTHTRCRWIELQLSKFVLRFLCFLCSWWTQICNRPKHPAAQIDSATDWLRFNLSLVIVCIVKWYTRVKLPVSAHWLMGWTYSGVQCGSTVWFSEQTHTVPTRYIRTHRQWYVQLYLLWHCTYLKLIHNNSAWCIHKYVWSLYMWHSNPHTYSTTKCTSPTM